MEVINKEAADRGREKTKQRRAAGEIGKFDPIAKAHANPKSMRLAINGKCWSCICGDADPNPRGRIRDCGIESCTLYALRPYQ